MEVLDRSQMQQSGGVKEGQHEKHQQPRILAQNLPSDMDLLAVSNLLNKTA